MSQTLRSFIREALIIEIGGSYGQDMRYHPIGTKPVPDPVPTVSTFLSQIGAFSAGDSPDYVCIADNLKDSLIVVVHSKSKYNTETFGPRGLSIQGMKLFQNELNAVGPLGYSWLTNLLFAKDITGDIPDDGFYKASSSDIGTYHMLDVDKRLLQEHLSRVEGQDSLKMSDSGVEKIIAAVRPEYFAIPRKDEFFTRKHVSQKEYTDIFKKNIGEFKCNLEIGEVIRYIKDYKPTDPEYALAAACLYSYAGSWTGAMTAGALTALVALPFTTPVGALLAGSIAMSAHDMIFRLVVIHWAYENGYTDFFYANLVYFFVCLLFASLGAFKALRALPVGTAIANASGAVSVLGKTLSITVLPIPAGVKEATWKVVVNFLAEFIVSATSYVFADKVGAVNRERIMAMLENTDLVTAGLKDSQAKLMKIAGDNYPMR